MTRALLALVLLAGAAPTARACLNDAYTGEDEREFRSRYDERAPGPIKVELGVGSLGALGAVLLAGAIHRAAKRTPPSP